MRGSFALVAQRKRPSTKNAVDASSNLARGTHARVAQRQRHLVQGQVSVRSNRTPGTHRLTHNGLWRSLVSVLVSGTRGRGFESRQPDSWKVSGRSRNVVGSDVRHSSGAAGVRVSHLPRAASSWGRAADSSSASGRFASFAAYDTRGPTDLPGGRARLQSEKHSVRLRVGPRPMPSTVDSEPRPKGHRPR